MSDERIPLVDLAMQNNCVAEPINRGLRAVLDSGCFVGGPDVVSFEAEYAAFAGVSYCVGVGNGTDAIELSIRAAGISAGSEIILPANTFIATAEAVVRAGCRPVLVDSDPIYHLIDPSEAAMAIGPRTGAIIGVDLYGQIAPFDKIENLGVPVIEDASQSQGAMRFGDVAGAFGLAAATSFYPGKNLGAFGDGGAVTTRDPDLARTVRALGSHGGTRKYEHTIVGFNSRLDTIQAVVLRAKLKHLTDWNAQRNSAAEIYLDILKAIPGIVLPQVLPGNRHVWHLFVIEVQNRDRVLRQLQEKGISAGIHYPTPIHLTEAFSYLGYGPGDFPVAEMAADRIISLPIYPGITRSQQLRIAEVLDLALAE